MPENDIVEAVSSNYLSRDPDERRKLAYIERTIKAAKRVAVR